MELVVVSLDARLVPEIPHDGTVLVVDGLSFAGTPELGAAALAPLGTCPVRDRAVAALVAQPEELTVLRADQERANPENHFYVIDSAYVEGERDDVVRCLAPAFTSLPTPKAFSIWFDMGRAPRRGLPDMALSLQTDLYFAAYLVGENEAQVASCLSWIHDRIAGLEPVTAGLYLGDSDLPRRPAKFMSGEAYARLQRIRAERDPDGVFCDYLTADGVPVNSNPWQLP